MKKIILCATVIFILVISLCSCSSNNSPNINDMPNQQDSFIQPPVETLILGEWSLKSQSYSDGTSSHWDLATIKLYEDGTCTVNGEVGTWKIVEDELMILGSYGGRFWNADAIVGSFDCDGNTLSFNNAQIDGKDTSVELVYNKVN